MEKNKMEDLTGILLFGLGLLSFQYYHGNSFHIKKEKEQFYNFSLMKNDVESTIPSNNNNNNESISTTERWSLKGKHIVVTGGTLGIGKAIVEECAKLGAIVLTCGRKPENMIPCFQEWQKAGLRDIHACIADISTPEGRKQLLASIEKTFPNKIIHILVNNVGTNIRKRAIEYSEEEYQFLMQTNLHSTFSLTKEIYPYLQKNTLEGSAVINIGSVAGGCNTALRSGVIYAMTKAAMAQMTYNLACEWAKENIRVNTIAPWYTETPLTKPFLSNAEVMATILQRTPMQRIAQADEVSGIVAFLSMNHASYITGQVIAVDGGFLRNGFF